MSRRPSLAREATLILGYPVGQFIADNKADGMPLRKIADKLREETANQIDTTEVSLRAWLRAWENEQQAEAGAA